MCSSDLMMMGYGISHFETPLIVRFFIVVFVIIFILFLTVFVLVLVRGVRQAHRNNQSPVLVIEALVVSKRQHISRTYDHLSTSYYATFEAETGSRMELELSATDFGLLAEGDRGRLTFQGTRYLGFQRR